MSSNVRMDKQMEITSVQWNVLLRNIKDQFTNTNSNMNDSQKHYIK